jgi:hypothetical protein
MHAPPAHSWPAAQLAQAPPPAPHADAAVPGWQAPAWSQQPLGQVAGSHVHALLRHAWPPVHDVHALPPAPHAVVAEPGWQAPFASQQPLGQAAASHAHPAAAHSWPAAQAAQAAPSVPQEAAVCAAAGTHTPPAQQPAGQEAPSQTQAPPAHSWPAPHDVHALPPAPQAVALCAAVGMHASPLQQPAQVTGSQVHFPAVQAWPAVHAAQVAPPPPHAPAVGVRQAAVDGSQQPLQFAGPHEQLCEPGSQVRPAGQSASTAQPQRAGLPARQTWPIEEEVQSTQTPPAPPHAVAALPGAQWPWLQQPPLQVPSPGPPQASLQPPAPQVGVRPVQAAQARPPAPHARTLWSDASRQVSSLLQQPPAQLSASHTQAPSTQR